MLLTAYDFWQGQQCLTDAHDSEQQWKTQHRVRTEWVDHR